MGCGDGVRGRNLFQKIKGDDLLLIDNSPKMIALSKKLKTDNIRVNRFNISKLNAVNIIKGKFDIILCLWNVFGHIPTEQGRLNALNNMRNLLNPNGRIYIDVNNRYNIIQYGLKNVVVNIIKDVVKTNKINGDFGLQISTPSDLKIKTICHIFTPTEIKNLIKLSKLEMIKEIPVNYLTGLIEKTIFGGQLFYILKLI